MVRISSLNSNNIKTALAHHFDTLAKTDRTTYKALEACPFGEDVNLVFPKSPKIISNLPRNCGFLSFDLDNLNSQSLTK